ncbi:MAG: hypothetical protein M1813_002596 [Trichoglossum hirsutum]|nr:MAG: hypothetical protein M1813_002596 [Trichoglossum hirsutum]
MAAPPLTIRNLTPTSLELKKVEHYEAPNSSHHGHGGGIAGVANITKSFQTLLSNQSQPTEAQIAENAQSFSSEDVSVRTEPFLTSKTDLKGIERPSEILRLTFETDGERYRLDVPSATNRSTTLVPLTPNPSHAYTAVFLPQQSHLTVFSSANLSSWMQEIKDNTPLSALSIPGTHNSPTYHRALPSVRCQVASIRDQLENGVRFFDIRVQPESPEDLSKDGLILVHGVFPISLSGNKYLRGIVNEIFAFLDAHPSETLIMSLKREGPGTHTDAQLSRILRDHYAGDVNHWYTAPRIPTLGEARRKIVLIRRFSLEEGLKNEWDGAGWCIDAESWAYNTPNDLCHSGDICVQDFCEVLETENIDKKIEYSTQHLQRAGAAKAFLKDEGGVQTEGDQPPPKQPFYLNFLSASNFWKVGCWPEKIAEKLNPAMVDFLCCRHNELEGIEGQRVGGGGTGIVVCDWVGRDGDWDLIKAIVGMNSKLLMREHH